MINNPFSLNGKKILVTGASSGIGQQCAISCSHMGAIVVLVARNEERLRNTILQMHGNNHYYFVCDLTIQSEVDKLVQNVKNNLGPIDGIINCAGISTTIPLKLMDANKVYEFFKTNVFSGIELTRQFCKIGYLNKEGASIIFLSSVMGCVGENGKSLYSMTKGALISAVRSLACEYAKRNIRFNAISPGAIITPINKDLPHIKNEELRKKLEEKHLLGLGKTSDVANAAIYLLSDASRWVTGQNFIIDGGYTII